MASLLYVILVLFLCVLSITHGRFILYDSDDSKTNKENGKHFADIKKTLANIFSKVNAIDEKIDEIPSSVTTSDLLKEYRCPGGWIMFKESCYLFDSKILDFQTAEKECNKWEAHIVHLETKEENLFLKTLIVNHFKNDYWIGMTDEEKEGVWKISGTNKIVPFTDWKGPEPNNVRGREHCALYWQDLSYGWADLPCGYKYRAICEKNSSGLNSDMD